MVRNGAFLLEQQYDRRNLAFGTVTMPAIPQELRAEVLTYWPEAVRQFQQWLKRRLERADLLPWIVGVSEVQSKRAKHEGWAPPHFHWAMPARHPFQPGSTPVKGSWAITPGQIRAQWRQIWERHLVPLGLPNNLYWGSCESLQQVKKSVARYLSKYLSKGNFVTSPDEDARRILPGWWHMTMDLKEAIWQGTQKGTDLAELLLNLIYEDPESFEYCHQVFIDGWSACVEATQTVKVAVGYIFKLIGNRIPYPVENTA
jgi:hypothetical protein